MPAASPSGSGTAVGLELEGPFRADEIAGLSGSAVSPGRAFAPAYEIATPFITEYFHESGELGASPLAEHYASLVAELYDREFEEALLDLTHEASALAEEQFAYEAGEPAAERAEAERGLRDHFVPLAAECENLVDRMTEGLTGHDLAAMSEEELEVLLDRYAPEVTTLPPVQEQFLGGFFKKVKRAVGGAARLARKGLTVLSKLTPINLILGRLKALVRPLLERVLRFAIDKLPVVLQPAARQLANKLLGIPMPSDTADTSAAPGTGTEPAEPAAADPAQVQEELDQHLAGYALQGEAFDRHAAVDELLADPPAATKDRLRELIRARARFCHRVSQLKEGEDAGPAVQEFVPAILAALKLGISVAGRPRVVNFLGSMVAQLIQRYIGPTQSKALANALVDAGLRAVSLEAHDDELSGSGEALSATVEDTVTRVAESAPPETWSNENELEGHIRKAFVRAASAHFPDKLLKPAIRESAGLSGAWVSLPPGPAKHYKKYSRIVEVTVTPQMAVALRTFRGHSLQGLLRDQLGLPPDSPVTGRLHLYEALAGTTLADVARHERGVHGLGNTRREAWSLFHPLTPEAAGILLKEPGLGRAVPSGATADHAQVAVGQRFYYLELRDATTRFSSSRFRRPAHINQVRLEFHFPRHELRLYVYVAERGAQRLASLIRRKAPAAAVIEQLQNMLHHRLERLLSGEHAHGLRLVHELVPSVSAGRARLIHMMRLFGHQLIRVLNRWSVDAFRRELEQRREQFDTCLIGAADAAADGITIEFCFQRPSFFEPLRGMLGRAGALPAGSGADLAFFWHGATADARIGIRPGYAVG